MSRSAFVQFIAMRRYLPFEWGVRDCCLLGADGLLVLTGEDFAEGVRGYKSQFGALRSLRRNNYHSVADMVADRLVQVRRPQFGTLVMLNEPPLNNLLICESAHKAWGQDQDGLRIYQPPAGATFWEPKQWVR